ncbi:MAG: hypothetical protein K9N10_08750 [Deltaproteobacteria bacterium]|nr:hypothetical protein [Deltaproteobacteria bacterium]
MKHLIKKHIFFLMMPALSLLLMPFVSTPWAGGDFHIISARYGIQGNYVDVTQVVKNLVSGHSISMEVSNQNLETDPVPGKEKEMVVFYENQGKRKELHVKEGDWFVVPGPEGGYRPPHHGAGDLEIIRGLYGAGGKYRIVTGDIQNHVHNNNINMLVSNENLGGDPAPNRKKELVVIYRKQGREYGAHLEEGSWFIITD